MGSLFSSPSPPPPLPPVPTPEDPAIDAARKKRRLAELRRKGRAATILTSGLGDRSEAPVTRPGLNRQLGGGR